MSWATQHGNTSYFLPKNKSCGNGKYFDSSLMLWDGNMGILFRPEGSQLCDSGKSTNIVVPKNYIPNANLDDIISRFRSYGFQPYVLNPLNKKPLFHTISVPQSSPSSISQSNPIQPPCPKPTPQPRPIPSSFASLSQINSFIDSHNKYRQTVDPPAKCMPNIQWANNLANSSQAWASKCTWKHSGTPGVGENLFLTSQKFSDISTFNPKDAVDNWGAEKKYYDKNTGTCQGGVCGHYTQMIWANSTNVGCAVQNCPKINYPPGSSGGIDQGTMVICQYSPPGNYIDEMPYQIR